MPKAKSSASKSDGTALDFAAQLCAAADKMRGLADAAIGQDESNVPANREIFTMTKTLSRTHDLPLPRLLSGQVELDEMEGVIS